MALFSTDKYLNCGSFSRTPVSRDVRLLPARLSQVNFVCLERPESKDSAKALVKQSLGSFSYIILEENAVL